ncbi:hypothetical protein HPB47_027058 [Ixodes persulcatus]|uniref:Uncharacterized protein n=1 Tax=Ixodes persulcatus TaxID=34615 RepID=A0AC60PWX6_IXOPE|nr:hypothetical protein HPB47_027058 [Ixodes persulcatus]
MLKPFIRGLSPADPAARRDFKVIIRPKKGLQVKSFTNHQISKAVSAPWEGKVEYSHFLVRLRPGSNIIIVSTPHQEAADFARKVTRIVLGGNLYEVNSYVVAPDGVSRGVIHGIDPETPPEELMLPLRVRTQGTKTAVVTFSSHVVPGYVYYYGEETECHPYNPTKQIRRSPYHEHQDLNRLRDARPNGQIRAHATGSRECKQRLKNNSNNTMKHLLHPPTGRRKAEDDNDGGRKKQQQQVRFSREEQPRRRRLRWFCSDSLVSRSRSWSRSRSGSRSRIRSEWPKQGEKQGQQQHYTSSSTSKQKNQSGRKRQDQNNKAQPA